MFNKLKMLKDLRSQAKTMQNALSGESATVEKGAVTVIMNGNMEITGVKIRPDAKISDLEKDFANAANDAIKKIQKIMAQKMQEMGGLPGFKM